MTTFTVATTVIFASLGLIALAFGLLARRYSFRVFAVGLVGLLVLATASTWITLAWPAIVNQLTSGLNRKLTAAKLEIQDMHGQLLTYDSQVQTLNSKYFALQKKYNAVETRLEKEIRGGKQAADLEKNRADDLDAKLKAEQVSHTKAVSKAVTVEAQCKKKSQQLAEKTKEAEQLKKEWDKERVKHIKTKGSLQICESNTEPSKEKPKKYILPTISPQILRAGLSRQLNADCYLSDPLRRRELVAGYTGNWYILRLKHHGKPLQFGSGQFGIPGDKKQIEACVRQLHKEVINPVAKVAKRIRLFVRGSANSRRIIGPVGASSIRFLTYLPLQKSGRYDLNSKQHSVAVPIHNKDLPYLRAYWLRQLIRPVLATAKPRQQHIEEINILQNIPLRKHNRTADFILYVKW